MPHYEQRKWEEEQMSSATFRFGAKKKEAQEEYDLIIDNQIEFIQALSLPGKKPPVKIVPTALYYFISSEEYIKTNPLLRCSYLLCLIELRKMQGIFKGSNCNISHLNSDLKIFRSFNVCIPSML